MKFHTRKWVKPEDLNPNGTLFGGRLLSWIDEEAALYTVVQLNNSKVVTKHMSEIIFNSKALEGDIIEIGIEVIQFGRTSISLKCEVRNMINLKRIHHVAYRCKDAKETVLWYRDMLKMDFILAIAEDHVPSTHEPDPYMHIFIDAGDGNVLAFFELPTKPEMGRDPNTPKWVQHIAFKVKDRDALVEYKEHLEAQGVEVLGVIATNRVYIGDLRCCHVWVNWFCGRRKVIRLIAAHFM